MRYTLLAALLSVGISARAEEQRPNYEAGPADRSHLVELHGPTVSISYPGSSAPLALIRPPDHPTEEVEHDVRRNPHPLPSGPVLDPVSQRDLPVRSMPTAMVDFLAQGNTGTTSTVTGTPPDTNGVVGPHDFVQTVNGGLEIWDKTGMVLKASVLLNSLWSNYPTTDGNSCAADNDGDPIVVYDGLADRWVISQFDVPNNSGPSWQCVAVSKTNDPTGAYWLYDFNYPNDFNDYPKLGIWPDAYYATFNFFSNTDQGVAELCAFDRVSMLQGSTATQQCFAPGSNYFGALPVSLEGQVPPPRGEPGFFAALDSGGTGLDLWTLHVDWTNTANTMLSGPTVLPVASYAAACGQSGTCIPEGSTGGTVDSLGDRLMFRLAYRNFGTHESLVVNHAVTSPNNNTGVRWYEIRSPAASPTIFQQATYAPSDTNWRWMGSIAQDMAQDMALGFSISSTTMNPSIAWTGRLASDATGTMGQGETILKTGTGTETGASRWGDYSNMTVDPSDDCTFWYTQELYNTTGQATWDTYIASVKFPNCGANDFSLPLSPTSGSVSPGSTATFTLATASTKGTAETITLSVQDLPAGVTGSFSPASVTAGQTSTLTLTAASSAQITPATTFTVIGTAASATHATTGQVSIALLPTVSITSPATGSVVSGAVTVTATASPAAGGTLQTLALAVDGANAQSGSSSPLNYSWNTLAVANGTHVLLATATDADNAQATASVSVTVKNPPKVVIAAPTSGATVSGSVTVTVQATPPMGGTVSSLALSIDGAAAKSGSSSPLTDAWDTTTVANGSHTLTATVTDSDGQTATASPVTVTVSNTHSSGNPDGGPGSGPGGATGGCNCGSPGPLADVCAIALLALGLAARRRRALQ